MPEDEGHLEAQRFEAQQHEILGSFDRAVWSAESVREYLKTDVLPSGLGRVEFEWKTVTEAYVAGRAELARHQATLDAKTYDTLQRTFNELKQHAEAMFGRRLPE